MVQALRDLVQALPVVLVEVCKAEDDLASTTRREDDGLFDAYDNDYQHRNYENKELYCNLTMCSAILTYNSFAI